MSYNQYYPSQQSSQEKDSLPITKNLSMISLFVMILTYVIGAVLQYTLFNPMMTGNADMRALTINGFILNVVYLAVYIFSLTLAIKGKQRNHSPILAIIMIVLSALSITFTLFAMATFLFLAPFILSS